MKYICCNSSQNFLTDSENENGIERKTREKQFSKILQHTCYIVYTIVELNCRILFRTLTINVNEEHTTTEEVMFDTVYDLILL